MSFHNTIGVHNKNLGKANKKGVSQEAEILEVFKLFRHSSFTPFDIQDILENRHLITSVRRAITNLTNAGKLVRTENKELGKYDVLNNTWRFK